MIEDDSCPNCRKRFNAHMCFADPLAGPKAGDLSLCIECGVVLEFNKAGKVALAMPETLQGLDGETRRYLAQARAGLVIVNIMRR